MYKRLAQILRRHFDNKGWLWLRLSGATVSYYSLGNAHHIRVQQGNIVHTAQGRLEHQCTGGKADASPNQVLRVERRALPG